MTAMVSNSIEERSMASSWISSWACHSVISCIRLNSGMATSMKLSPTSGRASRGSGVAEIVGTGLGRGPLEHGLGLEHDRVGQRSHPRGHLNHLGRQLRVAQILDANVNGPRAHR